MTIHYTVRDYTHRCALPGPAAADWNADCDSNADLEFLAEEAAAHFHSERDGWEGEWPLTITLYDGKTGAELGRFTVEREYEPSFHAQKAEASTQSTSAANSQGDAS